MLNNWWNKYCTAFSASMQWVHLVGGFFGGSIADTDESTLDKMMEMNVRSALLAIRAVLPPMRA